MVSHAAPTDRIAYLNKLELAVYLTDYTESGIRTVELLALNNATFVAGDDCVATCLVRARADRDDIHE